jgi:hypothetical protein
MEAEIMMCSVFPEERAVARYQWQWGETGFCSQRGQQMLEQQKKNLKQSITYLPLVQPVAAPLHRDERTRLIAERLSAESERDETLERNSRLYSEVTDLGSQLRTMTLKHESQVEQNADLTRRLASLEGEFSKQSVQRGQLIEELHKANLLLESGPGEEAAELESLRMQIKRAGDVEEDLRERLDAMNEVKEGLLKVELIPRLEAELRNQEDPAQRAVMESRLAAVRMA